MLLSSISLIAGLLLACPADSLQAVTVVADRGAVVSRTDTVRMEGSISVTDALFSVPGLLVTDHGGFSGLKNVSMRGLGSSHTAIYVDGVRIGNVQSGQTDLGMIDLSNCGSAVVDYAQNSLSFNTAKPVFKDRSDVGGKVRFRGGSYGSYEPSGRLDLKLSDGVSLSATMGGLVSRGDFPYHVILAQDSGQSGSDIVQRTETRANNDIRQVRAGLDSWGLMDDGNWHAKAYFSGAERGTPGSIDWPSTDRQKDRNAFLQGVLCKQLSPLYMLNASAKASFDDLLYLNGWGDNRYTQTEVQLNSSHRISIRNWLDATMAADFQWDGLDSNLYGAARTSVFSSVAGAFHAGCFNADLALEYSGIFDRGGESRNILSPSAGLRWSVLKGLDLVAFGRRAYRTPTFNEMYYPGYGNPDLKAEDDWLTDIGIDYRYGLRGKWNILVKADAFYNYLKDKIISAPTELDPSIWLPYNVGTVRMKGTDAQVGIRYGDRSSKPCAPTCGSPLRAGISARYSFQSALDMTPGSYSYGHQIPYVSRHTLCLAADASVKGWDASLNWNRHGGRYDSVGRMPDYAVLDLTVGKTVSLPKDTILHLRAIACNVCDCRYELAAGYPMPGRSFYGEMVLEF